MKDFFCAIFAGACLAFVFCTGCWLKDWWHGDMPSDWYLPLLISYLVLMTARSLIGEVEETQ